MRRRLTWNWHGEISFELEWGQVDWEDLGCLTKISIGRIGISRSDTGNLGHFLGFSEDLSRSLTLTDNARLASRLLLRRTTHPSAGLADGWTSRISPKKSHKRVTICSSMPSYNTTHLNLGVTSRKVNLANLLWRSALVHQDSGAHATPSDFLLEHMYRDVFSAIS